MKSLMHMSGYDEATQAWEDHKKTCWRCLTGGFMLWCDDGVKLIHNMNELTKNPEDIELGTRVIVTYPNDMLRHGAFDGPSCLFLNIKFDDTHTVETIAPERVFLEA